MDSPVMTDGFHLVLDALKLNGLNTIYGVAGIPVTDLLRLAQAEGMRYYGFRHESNAAHAASAAGYLNQDPGVCVTVSGPGFLNGLVALANSTTNCFPMILISGSSERPIVDLKQGDYEELDQMAAAEPYVKASYRINKPEDIGIGVARAIRAAVSGRPGGVYLDLPAELLGSTLDQETAKNSLVKVVDKAPSQIPSSESVSRAMDLLSKAERPLVILGKGASYAQADEEIRSFIESTGVPFLPMSMAKGLLPDDHPQSAAAARSYSIGQADVVMLVGARLNWLLAHGKGHPWSGDKTQFIQVDIESTEMDSNRQIAAPVVGDIKSCMSALFSELNNKSVSKPDQWMKEIGERRQKNIDRMAAKLDEDPHPMSFTSALRVIRDALADRPDIYVVNDGANTLDFGRNILGMREPRKRLDCGTWGVMGIGMGYAIAAAVESGKPVVAVCGDSAFGFSGLEIETVCRYELPIVTVVFNNGGIYQGDEEGAPISATGFTQNSRYDKVIEAFNGDGYHAGDKKSLSQAMDEAIKSGRPSLINCVIDSKAGTESGHLTSLNPKSSLMK